MTNFSPIEKHFDYLRGIRPLNVSDFEHRKRIIANQLPLHDQPKSKELFRHININDYLKAYQTPQTSGALANAFDHLPAEFKKLPHVIFDTQQNIHFANLSKSITVKSPSNESDLNRSTLNDDTSSNTLFLINQSLWTQHHCLEITANIDNPLLIIHSNSSKNFSHNRLSMVIKENVCLDIIEVYLGQSLLNQAREIKLEKNAQCNLITLNINTHPTPMSIYTQTLLNQNSVFNHFTFDMGHGTTRIDHTINLHGEHAKTNVFGLVCANNQRITDHHLTINHITSKTESMQHFRCIASNHAQTSFTGKIFVDKNIHAIKAHQLSKNILLDQNATAHSTPQLQINSDDVECSHGATIGSINTDELFYLTTRGLPHKMALSMLTKAFYENIVDQVPNKTMTPFILKHLDSFFVQDQSTKHANE